MSGNRRNSETPLPVLTLIIAAHTRAALVVCTDGLWKVVAGMSRSDDAVFPPLRQVGRWRVSSHQRRVDRDIQKANRPRQTVRPQGMMFMK